MRFEDLTSQEQSVLMHESVFRDKAFAIFKVSCREYDLLSFKQGTYLFKAGDNVRGLFILLSGIISLTTEGEDQPTHHGTIEPGQMLGDFELLHERVSRSYLVSAYAQRNSRVLLIPRDEVERFRSAAMGKPIPALALNMLADTSRKALRTASRLSHLVNGGPRNCGYILAEAIHSLLFGRDTDDVYVRDAYRLMDKRLETTTSQATRTRYANELKTRGVILHSVIHQKGVWEIDRQVLSEYLGCSREEEPAKEDPWPDGFDEAC